MKSLFRKTLQAVLVGAMLLLGVGAYAQQALTGRVVDTGGQPVIGASVIVEGTTNGVITDANGSFSIKAAAGSPVVISCLGYVDARANLQPGIVITLAENAEMLDETVVVGYGYQKKVTLTGAIASIQSDDILTTKSENMANLLSGKVAGFRVLQRTSEPGALDASFDIRGMGTPLIIIDGIPSTSKDFARLNGNEIENVSILKDASAAVYGVRAANGVVLITTKQGEKGRAKFSYDGTVTVQTPTNEPDLMDAAQYLEVFNEGTRNKGIGTGAANTYSDEMIQSYLNGTNKSYDWYGMAMNKFAPMHQHNLSASGGTDAVKYYASLGYLQQDGLAKSGIQHYEKWNIRSNLTAELFRGLKMNLNIAAIKDNKNGIPASNYQNVYKAMWRALPINNPYVDDDPSKPFNNYDSVHPAVALDESLVGYTKTEYGKISVNGNLTYDFPWVKGLSSKILYSYDHAWTNTRLFEKQYTLYETNGNAVKSANPSKLTRTYTPLDNSLWQVSLNYARKFGNHDIKGLLLYEESTASSDNYWVARQFTLDVLDELYAGNASNITGNSTASGVYTNVNKGLVGRINYSYKDKYLLEASFRYDASSKFMQGHQWGFFPSVSAGWRISEEAFIKDSVWGNVLTNLKIRANWGRMGDDSASSYQWLQGFSYPANTNTVWNRAFVSGSATTGVPNYNITWYTADMLDLGFDLDMWHGLFGMTFDWYRRDRDGLLATRAQSVPGVFGATFGQENLNSDLVTGYEIVLSHRNQIGDLRYNLSANLGYSRTMSKYVERASSTDSRDNWLNNTNNRWSSLLWGIDYLGQFASYDDIYNWASYQPLYSSAYGNQSIIPGDIMLGDWNEDGVIDENDKHVIGSNQTMPVFNYGLSASFSFKGIDLNILFQGAQGSVYQLQEKFMTSLPWSGGSNGLVQFMDRWHTQNNTDNPYDPNTSWIAGTWPSNRFDSGSSVNLVTTYATQYQYDTIWYLRLKSIELGYTFPQKWFRNTVVQRARIFANGFNLFTISNVNYIDPERPTTNYSYVYPLTKTFSVGVNLTF